MSSEHEDMMLDFHDETYVETKADRKTIIRAPFILPGTKTASLPQLRNLLPVRRKWIDHFTGSGLVSFNRPGSELEVMNDRYSGITSFYRCLRDPVMKDRMFEWLNYTLHSREDFYLARDLWCKETDDVIRAAKWFYMLRTSVIGKGDCFARQTNSKPQFPVQASLKWFEPIHCRLQNIIIENLDFEICHNDYDSEDAVHYFDPPYIGTDPGVYDNKWTRDDQRRLLRTIGRSRGFCALSGYHDEETDACTFWSRKYSWIVRAKAEVRAFTEENYKKQYEDVQQVDEVKEYLWIKDA